MTASAWRMQAPETDGHCHARVIDNSGAECDIEGRMNVEWRSQIEQHKIFGNESNKNTT
jgi:hypothetical protein